MQLKSELLIAVVLIGLNLTACVSRAPTQEVLNEPAVTKTVPTTTALTPTNTRPVTFQSAIPLSVTKAVPTTATPSPTNAKFVSSASPTPLPVSTSNEKCYQPFQKVVDLYESVANASSYEAWQDVTAQIVSATVKAGEDYLNFCTKPRVRLVAQTQALEDLKRFAEVIPSSQECGFRYKPTLQLIDLNGDGVDELVLHTQAANCDGYEPGFGGMSAVYYLSKDQWQGKLVWPCFDATCSTDGFSSQVPEPKIKRLVLKDSHNRAFMLVDGYFTGADALREILSIWRWDATGPKQVLNIGLSNWCGNPIQWTLTQAGNVFIPATKQTDRCAAERAKTYVLRNDEFVAVEQ